MHGKPEEILKIQLETIPLSEMGSSVRSYNVLTRHIINDQGKRRFSELIWTVGQLSRMTRTELCAIRNLGKRSTEEIEKALYEKYRIFLKD